MHMKLGNWAKLVIAQFKGATPESFRSYKLGAAFPGRGTPKKVKGIPQ